MMCETMRARTRVRLRGFDSSANRSGKQHISARGGATGGDIDPDLQAVILAWPHLTDEAKAGIVAMVRAASRAEA
jgi:hypothetical protein